MAKFISFTSSIEFCGEDVVTGCPRRGNTHKTGSRRASRSPASFTSSQATIFVNGIHLRVLRIFINDRLSRGRSKLSAASTIESSTIKIILNCRDHDCTTFDIAFQEPQPHEVVSSLNSWLFDRQRGHGLRFESHEWNSGSQSVARLLVEA